ncbi:YfiR family protein [Candidatus Symbiobacter mobilis]|uniref:Transmembrane protein n=1 Tax=Candidatus Symbiobacter mobilis CR TaxID=946483 RepID=U5NBZ2_9BURK|nr:YfiR family protein [Candidatus Symbiobacter mobilis]AGX87763.1 hypothetical protein Cenrod_1678 [Candidatus Symbiobacter mobilis CR]
MRSLFAALMVFWIGCAWGQDPMTVRMALLLNLARFTEWPPQALAQQCAMQFCIAPGDEALSERLRELAQHSAHDLSIAARTLNRPADAKGCHVLYLPPAVQATQEWFDAVAKRATLTVRDSVDGAESGAVIDLFPVGGRYRFDINMGAARRAGLQPSAHLLRLARKVR